MGVAADVFSGVTGAVVRQVKRVFTSAWEHPLVTASVVAAAGLIIYRRQLLSV